jgi:hypothetical protein
MRKHVHAAVMMFLARYAGSKENESLQRDRAKPKLSNTF